MIVQKYYCDRCNKEVKNEIHDLTTVEIRVKSHETKELSFYPNRRLDICDDCLNEIGFDRKQNCIPNPFNLMKRLFKK